MNFPARPNCGQLRPTNTNARRWDRYEAIKLYSLTFTDLTYLRWSVTSKFFQAIIQSLPLGEFD